MTDLSKGVETDFRPRAEKIAAEILAVHADAVDAAGMFPQAGIDALRQHGLLGLMVPVAQGGQGIRLRQIADICSILSRQCANTGMIYAMHQIQMASLLMCAADSAWVRNFLTRVAANQLLLASATSEAGVGGSMRTSVCALQPAVDGAFSVTKNATVISYGSMADAILLTARRTEAAPAADQILAVVERHQYTLERTSSWNTLGMRGTCSDGHILQAEANYEQVLPRAFGDISSDQMVPVSHILWGSLWFGIAAHALGKAQSFVRAGAKKGATDPGPGALRLAEAAGQLELLKSALRQGLAAYERATLLGDSGGGVTYSMAINQLKVNASEGAADIVMRALMICGIHGYRNEGPYTLGRHLRDVLSAPLMINNDRILGNTAHLLLAAKLDGYLSGH